MCDQHPYPLTKLKRYHQPAAAILFLTGSSDFKGAPVEEQVGHFNYILKTASPSEVVDRVAFALRTAQ